MLGVTSVIVLSFLPVGHTHEDIDQFFSRIAVYLRYHNARDRHELLEAIRAAYQDRDGNRPHAEIWDRVANISEWLEPNINKFDRISRYYQFIIKKSSTGNVIVRARPWPTSSKNEWVSLSTEEFSFETPVFKSPPPASFIAVPPSQRREVPEKKILDKYKKSLTDIAQTRSLSPANLNDLHHCLQLMASSDHLLFNWPHLSLSELSSDGYDPSPDPCLRREVQCS